MNKYFYCRICFSFLLMLFAGHLYAQNIFISTPEKLSTELIGFDILGKLKNGDVLIYKKYRFEDEVQVLDKQMQLKRSRDITLKLDNYETIELVKVHDEIFQFYTVKDNKMLYLNCQKYNTDLERKGDMEIIDSTSLRLGENYSEFRILYSKNEDFVLVYKYEYSGGRIDKLYTIVVNAEGTVVQRSMVNLPDDTFSPAFIKASISDSGKPVFLFENEEYNCRRDRSKVHYLFVMPEANDQFIITEIETANDSALTCIREFNFDMDNKNGDIVAIGFTGDDSRDAMLGYTFMRIQPATGAVIENNTYTFTQEMLDNIAGMVDKNAKYVPLFQVTTIVPRMDGGALLAAEFYEKTIENYETTNYDPYYGYRTSTRQIEYFEYSDVILLSLNKTGEIDWNNMIRKKQVSKEDKGVNSSFALANCKQSLYFIFNEDISQNSNVLQYQMTADGNLDRKSLFNPSQQEVELRPTSAKQISFNEIIIPSIYKRNIAFVKVVF
ncbi:MAG: hypothetical protein H7X71_01720 [Chitinophagales bacterium]|nr:hypothetical protein [Chitinophagales bacterium]